MKKVFYILLAAVVSAAIFAGCEASEESKQSADESAENSAEVSETVLDESDVSEKEEAAVTEIVVTGQDSDAAVDKFYEDEYYEYLFSALPQHEYVIVRYSDGTEQNVKEALEEGRITVFDLNKFDIEYLKVPKDYTILQENEPVAKVHVTSLPEAYDYTFDGADAQEIAEYLRGLTLISDFDENPDEYYGMTWVIEVEYENGESGTVCHFGNMFIRAGHGKWYKTVQSEAVKLDALIEKLNKQ